MGVGWGGGQGVGQGDVFCVQVIVARIVVVVLQMVKEKGCIAWLAVIVGTIKVLVVL